MPTARHHFALTLTGEFPRELSPGEISPASPPNELVESADSTSSATPGWVKRAHCDADLASIKEEKPFQACSNDRRTNRVHPVSLEESSGEDNDFVSLTFPKKFWRIVQSHQFPSIQWVDDGTRVVFFIKEQAFQKEVLAQRQPRRIFEGDSMKSFLHQLNLYRFSQVQCNPETSDLLDQFLREEAAAPPAYSKVHHFCCT
ncbi:PREDICTED: heat shock transcription factor, Y-linked-like [Pterocles gutturalis]|uniref:heat shock transcription factor, Y-linked-like n=1 Tax=Pterocles gutturalis TaxID=240206 RepID=UPI0005288792|nr:PREDICTED: heat shock transcription factor, Y-linked-like [Pterocles gutturalis]